MKIGFYDSGLGGISVLREFLCKYQNDFSYIYFGDSARAPYGSRAQAELLGFIKEILDYMQSNQVDLVISACNTTSMLINQIDLSNYNFGTINLFEVVDDYFTNDPKGASLKNSNTEIALLATSSNIDSQRYLDWGIRIHPIKCPSIVPLVESRDLASAKIEWNNYLNQIPQHIDKVIVGCTHYEFLVEPDSRFEFISPAKESLRFFEKKYNPVSSNPQKNKTPLEIFFTKNLEANLEFSKYLLGDCLL